MPTIFILLVYLASAVLAHQNSQQTGDALPGSHFLVNWEQLQSNSAVDSSCPLQSLAVLLLAFSHPVIGQHAADHRRKRPTCLGSGLRRAQPVRSVFKSKATANDDARTREMNLLKWLADNEVKISDQAGWGIPPHPLRVESDTMEDFERSGRGLIARRPINQGAPIVRVPGKLIMTKKKAIRQLGPRVIPETLGEYLSLAMLLIHERSLGAASFWAPYIGILPSAEEVGQTWTWDEEELTLLEGSAVLISTESLRSKLYSDFELLTATVIEPNSLDKAVFSWDSFKWAMSMLFSRAINLRETDELGLVPYADLVNHSPYINSYFNYEGVPLSNDRECVLYSDRTYAVNDQVLISYGQKSNAELILLYGFVVDRNVYDEVEITVGLSEDDPRYQEKADYLKFQGRPTRMSFPLLIDRFTDELMQYLRLCNIGQNVRKELDEFRYNDIISFENEMSVLESLKAVCYEFLSKYPETEEEDTKLVSNARMFAALPRNARMAIKLRRNEKRILLRTIQTCETRILALQAEFA